MRIGQLAKLSDCAVETIRYWEKEGLIPAPHRSNSNYRLYKQSHLERVLFVRNCRSLDMSLSEIRDLISLQDQPSQSCHQINSLVDEHIDHVVKRITALQSLEKELRNLRNRCNAETDIEHCAILQGLSSEPLPNNDDADNHVDGLHGH